jgi:hypothetical protein
MIIGTIIIITLITSSRSKNGHAKAVRVTKEGNTATIGGNKL